DGGGQSLDVVQDETGAGAALPVPVRRPGEGSEDVDALRYADALVAELDLGSVSDLPDAHGDRAALRCAVHRVLDQMGADLAKCDRVDLGPDGHVRQHHDLAAHRGADVRAHRGFQKGDQVHEDGMEGQGRQLRLDIRDKV